MYNDTRMDREDGLQEVPCSSSPLLRWTLAPLLGFIMTITNLITFIFHPKKNIRLIIFKIRWNLLFQFKHQVLTATAQLSFESLTGLPATQCTLWKWKDKKKNSMDFQKIFRDLGLPGFSSLWHSFSTWNHEILEIYFKSIGWSL